MSGFSYVVNQASHFHTNHNLSDWEIIDVFDFLRDEADEQGLDLETCDDGGFVIRIKDSKNSDHVFKCCQNLREVEVFLKGWCCANGLVSPFAE